MKYNFCPTTLQYTTVPVILLTHCEVCQVGNAGLLPLSAPGMHRLILVVIVTDKLRAASGEVRMVQAVTHLQ